ncbi:MAG: C4-dicarboxylate ABC transporter substrate-binding protein [Planctomycetes bacterium GWF2_41_51]|nr:MAG: C4-dicarboxylate ABC transporter substrate-binding protein [Planctomycetes bacterium GWF2_41_51]
MKKYVYLVICFLLVCVCLNGCKKSSDNTANETTIISLTYANFPPASTFPCVQMERWKTEVEKRTNGKVVVKTFPGGTLLDAKDMMDGVIAGQADIGCLCMAYQPGRFAVTNALALPLGIKDAKTGSKMLWDLYNKYKPAEFEQVNVLTMFTTAPSNIMSRKPVRTLGDIKGMSLRASGGAGEILQAWGANMVGMPMSATPEALQKGVVHGLFSSLEVMKDFSYAELCKYVTMTDTSIYPFAVVMNKQKFESLPDDVKKVFDDLAAEQMQWTGEYMDNHVAEAIEFSKQQHQVEFIELTDEQKAEWNKLLEPIIAKWIEDNKSKIPAEQIVADLKSMMQEPK